MKKNYKLFFNEWNVSNDIFGLLLQNEKFYLVHLKLMINQY